MNPDKVDKLIMRMMQKSKRVSGIIEEACGEAYEMGFNAGLVEGSKINGKKYANKVKKAIKNQYKA
jgi:transposase